MKKYLFKSLQFISVLVLSLIIIGFVLPYNNDGYIRAQKFKMDKLADPRRKPTIVILGGSNAAFGYDTKLLNDSLKMPVFNAGLHAGLGMNFSWMIPLNISKKEMFWCLVRNMISSMEI